MKLTLDEPRQAMLALRGTLVGLAAPRAPLPVHAAPSRTRHRAFGDDVRVRHLVGLDPGRHGVAVADLVEPGMTLAFCHRDVAAARRDLTRICAEIREELAPEPAELATAAAGAGRAADAASRIRGAVYVSCAGRGGPHFGAPSAELQIIRHALGDVPLAGFFAGGEIGHQHLYGYTGVLTVFTRRHRGDCLRARKAVRKHNARVVARGPVNCDDSMNAPLPTDLARESNANVPWWRPCPPSCRLTRCSGAARTRPRTSATASPPTAKLPLVVALPETEAQVAAVLKACHALAVPVVARGAGTGLSGGAMPHRLGVTLALAKFNRIVRSTRPRAARSCNVACATWRSARPRRRSACTTHPIRRPRSRARSAVTWPRTQAACIA